ncbi:HlyD family secretion protein [Devosia sp. UYZn731]|uniref:HlyD family type I secretion periplasmic adaptor subunit n=1 Tax=Devosia sp. UYZn731 TaxID=3156345 RepID=UPI003395656C
MTAMADVRAPDDRASLSRHSWTGLLAVFGLFGGLIYWASTVEIAGAVMASGSVVVESYAKRIQHQEGGIVKAFYVKNEDVVTEGQLLARLDDTAISADLGTLETQLREALVRDARLSAEIVNAQTFALPSDLAAFSDDPEVLQLMQTEQQVLAARGAARTGRIAQLAEQVNQLEQQIDGTTIQQAAVDRQLEILGGEIAKLSTLYEGQLVESSRVSALDKQQADLDGVRGRLIAGVAELRASIAERNLQITQLTDDALSTALDQLQETRRSIAAIKQQKRATLDRLQRTYIRAPQSGVIHESIIHTLGGVIGAGETLMLVVPQGDELTVNLRLSPMDVDKIRVGQEATLRLASFDQRTTPELIATVAAIAPDVTQEPATGQQFYSARIAIAKSELGRLPRNVRLVPGMPVEAFVKTEDRTVLSYLIHPFVEQLNRAMRED